MVAKGGLFIKILVALAMRNSMPIKRGCSPSGFQHFEPFMLFTEAEDTGLLWMYALHSPPRPKMLSRVEMLLRTRFLIMILLLIGCLRVTLESFVDIIFFYYLSCAV